MANLASVSELVLRWEELKQRGETVSVEELCSPCPELAKEVARRIRTLESFDRLIGSGPDGGQQTPDGDRGETPSDLATELEPPRQLGRYRREEFLGKGGFGEVWRGRDSELQRSVAIKIARPDRLASTAQTEAFLKEARKAAMLTHPGIVPVHDVGREGLFCYIVSELIEGPNLKQRIAGKRLPLDEAVRIAVAVAEALHYAHLHHVVHRDVKSANILLDPGGNPHLTDFGLAKQESDDATKTAEDLILGTLPYMAPEQAEGRSHLADCRTDVYSLGVVLFEMLTGELPFRGSTHMLLRQISEDDPPEPRKLDGTIPRDLETVCLKCLEKAPPRRYQSAEELADDLARFRRGEPVLARPVGRAERAWRWCHRNPAVAALTGAAAILVLVLAAGAVVWAVRESRLRLRAENETEKARLAENQAKEANASVARSLAETTFLAARLAGQRGDWDLALKKYEEALAAGHPDPVGVRVERIKALAALGRVTQRLEETDRLARYQDLGQHKAEALLLQATGPWSKGRDDQALGLIRQAIELTLPPAEEAYARGLIAPTIPKAVGHYRQALQRDPWHHQAMCNLCGSLLLLGQLDESRYWGEVGRRLFPEDANFPLVLAMTAALDGDRSAAMLFLDDACLRMRQVNAWLMRTVVVLAYENRNFDWRTDSSDPLEMLLGLLRIVWSSIERQLAVQTVNKASPPLEAVSFELISGGRSARELMRAMWEVLKPSLRSLVFGKTRDELLAAFNRAAEICPEANILMARAFLLSGAGRLEEAEAGFLAAANAPAWLPLARRRGYCEAAITAHTIFLSTGCEEDLRRSVSHVLKYFDAGMVTPREDALRLRSLVMEAQDFNLARRLISLGLRAGSEDVELLRWQAEVDFLSGSYGAVIDTAEALLRLSPKDPKALALRQEAAHKLRERLDQIAPGEQAGSQPRLSSPK